MKIIQNISEDEMIAVFLQAEMESDRFSPTLLSILDRDKQAHSILTNPDVTDVDVNHYRKQVIGEFRGYGRDEALFGSFPREVEWKKVLMTEEELSKVLFIDWEYWTDVTDGTRSPTYLANKILTGQIPVDKEVERFSKVSTLIKSGKKMPTMIFVAKDEDSRIVVLEGHVRLASYFLVPEMIPAEMEVIIGFSDKMDQWSEY